MDMRKRPGGEFANGALKKSKLEIDSFSSGIGSKSKPCTKFFSTSGCPFGENCHFLHYVPGGYNAVAQMMNLPPATTSGSHHIQNGSAPALVKTKICNRYKTAEGCKYGDKCHFAHGEWELGKPITSFQDDPHSRAFGALPGHYGARAEPSLPGPAAAGFGASATAKISVDASLAGAVIGKGGVNSKQICRQTGVKLYVREHEMDPNLRNIELEGTFEQIQEASAMVREVIVSISSNSSSSSTLMGKAHGGGGGANRGPGNNLKTKLCENFSKGSCTFGDKCHFAHGVAELRKPGV
ncbi:zinc finger CCCH domain-containing protein 14-like [Andrographis paniculata]|uniref:zinc finger CCCH domain-containing protein 14-like n=1 Tax=Andrographis paniculata TaxID=175694 RepID=UPI0021E94B48|nr:zinc finger CCCH domain-containing protein 14-like [Andrographis paniculata]